MRTRNRGLYIWVVGPDGCGKSSLCRNVAQALDARHTYWRPGILPMPKELLGEKQKQGVNSNPHARTPDSRLRALFRSLYYFVDYYAGTHIKIRSENRRGRHYLLERGWGDMIIDPLRYGFPSSFWTSWYRRILPRPDVICLITATVEEIASRKGELSDGEVLRQYSAWRCASGFSRRFIEHKNSGTLEESTTGLVERIIGLAASGATGVEECAR